ncbi:hypothetical protein EVAR_61602_1 [Eumeta japonica]|uniref:Uncharacterized protein n=1 Tax=Eumeta variegata TaxID=151549 RepID=A0A4C1SDW4_EUMVA|nr:hypothetical protein EVAR_61602_1 [Eumeta japonica]
MAFISGVQTRTIPEPAEDQEELSVGTPTSSSTVTAVSGSDAEGGSPLHPDRRNSTMENLDDFTFQNKVENASENVSRCGGAGARPSLRARGRAARYANTPIAGPGKTDGWPRLRFTA